LSGDEWALSVNGRCQRTIREAKRGRFVLFVRHSYAPPCGDLSGVRVTGALSPFLTPTEPTISYPIFRMTLLMRPRASSGLRPERRMLKGRERPGCGSRRKRTVIPIDCGQRSDRSRTVAPVDGFKGSLDGVGVKLFTLIDPVETSLSSHPLVRSAPSFRPDPHAPRAAARSGGQGWPVFGPSRQRHAASLTAASTTAGSIASGASRRTHHSWGRKRTHGHLPDFSGGLRRVSPSRARRCAVCTRRSRTASAIVGRELTGYNRRMAAMAIVDDFEQVAALLRGQWCQPPSSRIRSSTRARLLRTCIPSVAAYQCKCVEQAMVSASACVLISL
jgi:hypothetical protein